MSHRVYNDMSSRTDQFTKMDGMAMSVDWEGARNARPGKAHSWRKPEKTPMVAKLIRKPKEELDI